MCCDLLLRCGVMFGCLFVFLSERRWRQGTCCGWSMGCSFLCLCCYDFPPSLALRGCLCLFVVSVLFVLSSPLVAAVPPPWGVVLFMVVTFLGFIVRWFVYG